MTRSNSSRRRSAASGGMLRAAWTRGAHLLAAISLQLALNPPCSAASLTLPTTAIGMVRTGISFAKTPLTFAADLDAHETSSTRSRSRRTFSSISTSPTCAPRRRPPDIIRAKAHGRIEIRGYMDALGTDAYNQRLSEQRAASVKTWLAGHEQLAATRLATSGPGAGDPVASFAVCCRLRAETRLAELRCLSSPRPCRPSSSLPTGHARHRLW
jgi:OmpA family